MQIDNEKEYKFLDAINKYAQQKRNEIKNEAENFKKQELKKAKEEAIKDAYKLIQRETAQMKKRITKEHSKRELERKKLLLNERNKITISVFNEVQDRLVKFTNTQDYKDYLERCAINLSKSMDSSDEIFLYLKVKDIIYTNEVKKAFGRPCVVKTTKDILIGGIYGFNVSKGIIVDETLDAKLEVQKDWFKKNSNLSVL